SPNATAQPANPAGDFPSWLTDRSTFAMPIVGSNSQPTLADCQCVVSPAFFDSTVSHQLLSSLRPLPACPTPSATVGPTTPARAASDPARWPTSGSASSTSASTATCQC